MTRMAARNRTTCRGTDEVIRYLQPVARSTAPRSIAAPRRRTPRKEGTQPPRDRGQSRSDRSSLTLCVTVVTLIPLL